MALKEALRRKFLPTELESVTDDLLSTAGKCHRETSAKDSISQREHFDSLREFLETSSRVWLIGCDSAFWGEQKTQDILSRRTQDKGLYLTGVVPERSRELFYRHTVNGEIPLVYTLKEDMPVTMTGYGSPFRFIGVTGLLPKVVFAIHDSTRKSKKLGEESVPYRAVMVPYEDTGTFERYQNMDAWIRRLTPKGEELERQLKLMGHYDGFKKWGLV